jgi:ABC-2 type transport system ATP-binding protein
MAAELTLQDVSLQFGGIKVLQEVSFAVEPGQIFGLVGPNGAGKTTTLRILLGLVRPTTGRATIDGAAYRDLTDPIRHVGAVLEATNFHPKRSGRNHLRMLAAGAGVATARVDFLLEFVGLADAARRAVGGYSLGMRQRLSVAGALLADPRVLVLDEPANGLDPEGIRWLRDFLRSLAAEGKTVFISSHVLGEIQQIADEVVIIHRGRLVAQNDVAALTARAAGATRVRSPEAARLRDALAEAGLDARGDGDELSVTAPAERVGEIAASRGIVLHELTSDAASLEEAFLALTGEGGASQ